MGYTNTARNAALDAIGAAGVYIGMHTGDPTAGSGTAEVTSSVYSRQPTAWSPASSGSKVGTQVAVPVPAGTTVTYWSLWTAVSGGIMLYSGLLPAPESYGGQGAVNFTPTLTAGG